MYLTLRAIVFGTFYDFDIWLQLQLQSGYLVTSASRHLTKDYIYTRAQQSLKVKKKQHIYTVQVYGRRLSQAVVVGSTWWSFTFFFFYLFFFFTSFVG